MALFRSLFYLIGFGGLGYALLKVTTGDGRSSFTSDHPVNNTESSKKRQAIVDVLRRAAEDKEPMYRLTKEQIDARIAEESTKKKP